MLASRMVNGNSEKVQNSLREVDAARARADAAYIAAAAGASAEGGNVVREGCLVDAWLGSRR